MAGVHWQGRYDVACYGKFAGGVVNVEILEMDELASPLDQLAGFFRRQSMADAGCILTSVWEKSPPLNSKGAFETFETAYEKQSP